MNDVNRVVVTGAGIVSPIGQTVNSYYAALKQGVSGIGNITIPYAEELNQKVVAEVKDFDPTKHFDERQLAVLDRVSQFAVVAAREAIAQAGIDFSNGLSERTATIIGIGVGGQTTLDDQFRRLYKQNVTRAHPLTIPRRWRMRPPARSRWIAGCAGRRSRSPAPAHRRPMPSALHFTWCGPALSVARSPAARRPVSPSGPSEGGRPCASWRRIPAARSRRTAKAWCIGEGAAVIVLEPLEAAQARGATILAEIVGFGMSADAKDITSPDQGGMVRAIEGALADAKLGAGDIQYVNAHGTGTTANDVAETKAIKQVFGRACRKARGLVDQVDGRACARRLRRARIRRRADERARRGSCRRRSAISGPIRRAISTMCRTRRERCRSTPRCRTHLRSAGSTRCWRSGGIRSGRFE